MSAIDSRIANLGDNQPVTRTERAPVTKVEAAKVDETTAKATLDAQQRAAQAVTDPATEENSEDANIIDPNKPILLPNGERITFKEWNDRGLRYDQYVRKQSETDAQYKARVAELDKNESDYNNAKIWRNTAENDPFANAYLMALSRTKNPQEAMKEAQRITGQSMGTQNARVDYSQAPPPPNDDPSSPEYNRWFLNEFSPWQAEQAAQRIAAPKIDKLERELAGLRAERQQELELTNAQKQRADANTTIAATAFDRLYNLTGINVTTLPPEEVKKISSLIEQGFAEIGLPVTDTHLWSTEEVKPRDVDHVIRAVYGKLNNPYVIPKTEDAKLAKPRANSATQLHNAAPNAGQNGTAKGVSQGSPTDRFSSPIERNMSRLIGSDIG